VCLTTDTSSAVSDVPQTTTRKIHIQCVQKDNMQTTLWQAFQRQQILITVRDTASSFNETLGEGQSSKSDLQKCMWSCKFLKIPSINNPGFQNNTFTIPYNY
jgi:hypothetical protein